MFGDIRSSATAHEDTQRTAPQPAARSRTMQLPADYWALYRSIEASAASQSRYCGANIVDFLAMHRGEGVSTIVSSVGVAAAMCGRRTLIIDMDPTERTQQRNFGLGNSGRWAGWQKIVDGAHDLESAVYRHGTWPLFLLPPSPEFRALAPLRSEAFQLLLQNLACRFDLILIDSPPAAAWPDGIELGRLADGLVLVVEAERARWPVSDFLKERCLQGGVNVLGVVMNKRRYYIPRLLYRLL